MMTLTAQQAAEHAIRDFSWDDYSLHDAQATLEYEDRQDWVRDLAIAVTRAILLKINYGSPFGANTSEDG